MKKKERKKKKKKEKKKKKKKSSGKFRKLYKFTVKHSLKPSKTTTRRPHHNLMISKIQDGSKTTL